MDLFPFVNNTNIPNVKVLPLLKELAWDYDLNKPCLDPSTNDFIFVEGIEALKILVYKALITERYKFSIYSSDYGNEMNMLFGKGYTKSYTEIEVTRYIKECLSVNKYITEIQKINSKFKGSTLEIEILITSVYGEVVLNVRRDDTGKYSVRDDGRYGIKSI